MQKDFMVEIEPQLVQQLEMFEKFLAGLGIASPLIRYDGSWPAVGLIDLLTSNLRTKPLLNEAERWLVGASSLYLGRLIGHCWTTIGAEVSISNTERGVTLTAHRGYMIPAGEQVTLELEMVLLKVLEIIPNPFPVLSHFARPLLFEQNLISPLMLGLVLGTSPWVDGVWSNVDNAVWQDRIERVVRQLAASSAEYYSQVFPDEGIGQVAELYLSDLIYPPVGCGEEALVADAVRALGAFSREYKIPLQNLRNLAHNFAQSPDERILYTGFALSAALTEGTPDTTALAYARALPAICPHLRTATVAARKAFAGRKDWLEGEGAPEDRAGDIEIEKLFGMLPTIYLSAERLGREEKGSKLLSFARSSIEHDYEAASMKISQLIAESPADHELRLQEALSELVSGDIDQAESMCRKALDDVTPTLAGELYVLQGRCEQIKGNDERAIRLLETAASAANRNPRSVLEAQSALGELYSKKGDPAKALRVLDPVVAARPWAVQSHLLKVASLYRLGRVQEAHAARDILHALAPLSRRVFNTILLERLIASESVH